MGLRKGQKELVEQYRGGYCAVPAIPGGGKTHCLSLWAVEMIAQGLNKPGKILIVTYMNSAVSNFKQRISSQLQKRGIAGNKDYFVCTIHSLCLQIIKEKPDLVIANEDFNIIDEVRKVDIVNHAIDEWRRKNEDRFAHYLDEANLSANKISDVYKRWQTRFADIVLSSIGDFKCRGISPVEALEKCRKLPDNSLLKCASEIYEVYDRRLKTLGFMDFDDMLHNAKKLLQEDASLLEKYRKKYTFVCEDEAQDSNLIQTEILTLIANGNLLRVGDSNQAICGSFTNSDFKFFKNFCSDDKTTTYNITQSSRNTRDIINLANYFVKLVRESHPVIECRDSLLPQYIEPVDVNDERTNPVTPCYGIRAEVFESREDEDIAIVNEAWSMLKKHPEKTMAILIPGAWRIDRIVNILDKRNIPFEQLDNSSRERNRTIRQLGRIIDFIALPESGEKLFDMMNECFLPVNYDMGQDEDNEEANIEEIVDKIAGQRKLLQDFLKAYPVEKLLYPRGGEVEISEIPEELIKSDVWKEFSEKLEMVREFLEFPETVVEKLILYISEKLEYGREERAIAQKVASDVRYLMNQNPRWRLSDLAFELLSPKNVFNFFASIVWDLKGYEPKPGVITLCTYHKSKGLEWDAVFLGGLDFEDFPVLLNDKFKGEYWFLKLQYRNPKAIAKADMEKIIEGKTGGDSILESKIETISEKARLLYVGITRAKEYLYLSGYHANPGKRNEILPSRYLIELKKYIDEQRAIENQKDEVLPINTK